MKTDAQSIQPGAIVCLPSGGPQMTVVRIIEDSSITGEPPVAKCQWFELEKGLKETHIPVAALEVVKAVEDDGSQPDPACQTIGIAFSGEKAQESFVTLNDTLKELSLSRLQQALVDLDNAINEAKKLGVTDEAKLEAAGLIGVSLGAFVNVFNALKGEASPKTNGDTDGSQPNPVCQTALNPKQDAAEHLKKVVRNLNLAVILAKDAGLAVDLELVSKYETLHRGKDAVSAVISDPRYY